MQYEQLENKIILSGYKSFDLEKTLECGQTFRFRKESQGEYKLIAHRRILHIKQTENEIIFYETTLKEFEDIWFSYFDLGTDYDEIEKELSGKDEVMGEAVFWGHGIRILKQDIWEMIISFIISQNNHIPRIKQIIERISRSYGDELINGHAFPRPEQLAGVSIDDFYELKTGFRAVYLADAVKKIYDGEINIENFEKLPTPVLQKELMKIKGVGPKVANCVMIFSCGRRESFPIDVWVKRMMESLYFDGRLTDMNAIQKLAEERFGALAGYAQQYLFHWARKRGA